jgi:hypothetical protein
MPLQMARLGAMDLSTRWSIVFCAGNGARPPLIAAASFFPIGIVYGAGI